MPPPQTHTHTHKHHSRSSRGYLPHLPDTAHTQPHLYQRVPPPPPPHHTQQQEGGAYLSWKGLPLPFTAVRREGEDGAAAGAWAPSMSGRREMMTPRAPRVCTMSCRPGTQEGGKQAHGGREHRHTQVHGGCARAQCPFGRHTGTGSGQSAAGRQKGGRTHKHMEGASTQCMTNTQTLNPRP